MHVPLAIRWLDMILLALALPVFVLADLPIAGYFAAASAWIAQRAVQLVVQRRVSAADDPRTVVGLTVGSMIARGWIVAGAVCGVGVAAGDQDGLAAAVLVLSLFTVYFATQMTLHPFENGGARR